MAFLGTFKDRHDDCSDDRDVRRWVAEVDDSVRGLGCLTFCSTFFIAIVVMVIALRVFKVI